MKLVKEGRDEAVQYKVGLVKVGQVKAGQALPDRYYPMRDMHALNRWVRYLLQSGPLLAAAVWTQEQKTRYAFYSAM